MPSQFRIGDLTLDTGRRRLLCRREPIPLGPLTYKLLLTLAEVAPNVASRDELIDSVWDGRSVSPETISQRVKLLRDALADDPHRPRYIELVRGQGYRLIPPVEVIPPESTGRQRSKAIVRVGAGLFAVAAAAVIFWFATASTGTPEAGVSVAVLPFVDMSPQQNQEYFADGVSEEILDRLSQTTTLEIIGRTSSFSFKNKNADVSEIAEVLGVTHILEGSVRRAGDRVRVTARLVDTSDGTHVWSDSYNQEIGDILGLQGEIAASVAAALRSNLQTEEVNVPSAGRRVDPESYELYLRGAQQLRTYSGTARAEAVEYFEQSIAVDPEFIPAYYSLGLAYVLQVVDLRAPMPRIRSKLRDTVDRGLSLAPDDPGLIGLSGQLARWDRDFELAEQRFRLALEKDSSNLPVQSIYAMFKLDRGYPDEALELKRRLLKIDPLNPLYYTQVWASHLDLGNAEKAIAAALHRDKVAAASDPIGIGQSAVVKLLLLGDIAGSIRDMRRVAEIQFQTLEIPEKPYAPPLLYYYIGDLETGDIVLEIVRNHVDDPALTIASEAYGRLAYGEIDEARNMAVTALGGSKLWAGDPADQLVLRLAVDALIESGKARRAVDFIETLAPVAASYRSRRDIAPQDFSPPPIPLRSAYSSYPALYFPDYIRALLAVGDDVGADNMLGHLETILELRRQRGLFIEERHTAEALALRGRTEAALDALEKAERDRTIYNSWQLFVLHNEIFAGFRDHPRFEALVDRIRREMNRQREKLRRDSPGD